MRYRELNNKHHGMHVRVGGVNGTVLCDAPDAVVIIQEDYSGALHHFAGYTVVSEIDADGNVVLEHQNVFEDKVHEADQCTATRTSDGIFSRCTFKKHAGPHSWQVN